MSDEQYWILDYLRDFLNETSREFLNPNMKIGRKNLKRKTPEDWEEIEEAFMRDFQTYIRERERYD